MGRHFSFRAPHSLCSMGHGHRCATYLGIPSFCLEDACVEPLMEPSRKHGSHIFRPSPPPGVLSYCRGEEAPHFLQVSSDPARDANCQSSTRVRLSSPCWGPSQLRVSLPGELGEGYYKSSYRGKVGGLDNSNRCSGYYETVSMVSNPKDECVHIIYYRVSRGSAIKGI